MNRKLVLFCVLHLFGAASFAQSDPPELSAWLRNTTGLTGYNNLPANIQQVRYSSSNVYVNASGIPAYSIGPWPGDPNTPTNQSFLMRFPRSPVVNNGTKTSTPLGPIGMWINGVPVFNSLDAMSYNNQNIWHQNAVVVEAASFDACLGHPAPGGVYHHHQNPRCLYSTADTTQHSPLIGYAFDGFPIYGAYGFANSDGSGGTRRMRSSYRTRSITQRHTLPDGTTLSPSQYGPDVSAQYPLGYYAEDFEYVGGLGDLDAYNGRTVVTPEFPGGTYAYFATIGNTGSSAYPYVIGTTYYGIVAADNLTSHGHVTINESVSTYNPTVPAVPQLLFPSSGATLSTSTIDFRWNSSSGAVSYSFQVASDSQFTALVYEDSLLTDTAISVSSQTMGATNYWRVRAKNNYGLSEWSSVRIVHYAFPYHWYMVSVPGVVPDASTGTLFPGYAAGAFHYAAGSGYVQEDTLRLGVGYWMKLLGDYTQTFSGDTVTADTVGIVVGWNLIGSITNPIAVSSITSSSPGMIVTDFFGYDGMYRESDTIRPGYAYWVKANESGTLILASPSGGLAAGYPVSIVPTAERPPAVPESAINNLDESSGRPQSATSRGFLLGQNYPNPFNPKTVISYSLSVNSYVSLRMYDVMGKEVATIVEEVKPPGEYHVSWDASSFPSGVYFYRLRTAIFTDVKKLVLLK